MRQTFPELAVIDVRTAHLWRALETANEQFDHRGQPFFWRHPIAGLAMSANFGQPETHGVLDLAKSHADAAYGLS
jgi:hypothetical protein